MWAKARFIKGGAEKERKGGKKIDACQSSKTQTFALAAAGERTKQNGRGGKLDRRRGPFFHSLHKLLC